MTRPNVRCAIYTRKSSEEGLEQNFNSLEAQREACVAYVQSQKHEGWIALNEKYDDGGFSGGTMERPALKRLLGDIQSGRVGTVVVYKVDRLTRSLTDFAKIIEILDSHHVSFVSVTQHFNTTSSMGRLTLNVLLSFAQFEREVTGERIRDKIAASKKRGMWMGGQVPLGYDCVERELVINSAEAHIIRTIFRNYLRLASVRQLKEFLDRKGIRTKRRKSATGRRSGGVAFSRGCLYHILSNRIYVGEIPHRTQSYPGNHQPIVTREVWDRVAALLQENDRAHRAGKSRSSPSMLSGKLFDATGLRFTPTHAVKNGKRYRYYTSQAVIGQGDARPAISRFPAEELEQLVNSQFLSLLQSPEKCTADMEMSASKDAVAANAKDMARKWPDLEVSKQHDLIRSSLKRVVVSPTKMTVEVLTANLLVSLLAEHPEGIRSSGIDKSEVLTVISDLKVLHRGREIRLVTGNAGPLLEKAPVPSLAKAVARAREWYEQIVAGDVSSIDQLAQASRVSRQYVLRVLPCANLSPRITEAVLMGSHRPDLTLNEILRGVPLDWREQEQRFLQLV